MQKRLKLRQKAVDYGRNTKGYQAYIKAVPKNLRTRDRTRYYLPFSVLVFLFLARARALSLGMVGGARVLGMKRPYQYACSSNHS
jgi:hypothetical protein